MKIAVLGAGTWGYCLASLLASKGYQVMCWGRNPAIINELNATGQHPKLPKKRLAGQVHFTTDIQAALLDATCVVESVTTKGIRETLPNLIGMPPVPIVFTSKGIELNSGLVLPEIALDILGEGWRDHVGVLSGPSYAQEVIQGLPTSVAFAAYSSAVMLTISEVFSTKTFRVYPNSDVKGVAFGGALKNCIAIACGVSDGLGFGNSSKAAVMTRGLHEMRKLGVALGCKAETFYGLSGMGDIFLTCSSLMSRNFRFGYLLAKGKSPEEAQREIGMVVEGANTCFAALQLGQQHNIPLPITDNVARILEGTLQPAESVAVLMQRTVKEEHL
jgi:glycerol-3-phosphate dehydrogenase (NAD(P)+)